METMTAPDAQATQMPSPNRVFEAMTAFELSAAIRAGIELDIFTAIADGAKTADALASACKADARAMRILCDFLTISGFLTKSGSEYGLAPDAAAFLSKRSPAYMGSGAFFLTSEYVRNAFADIAGVVRKGGTLIENTGLDPEHPMWVEFARSMMPMMMLPANLMANILIDPSAGPIKVLDIAAGHGIFGITLAQRNPQAQVTGVDWSNVLNYAADNATKFGVADRYRKLAGSAFDVELEPDYDIVLVTNFVHHFDVPTNEQLLSRLRASLKPGGKVAILEFVPNDDRITPPMPASFSMMMLASTPSGDAYTEKELSQMLRNSGFKDIERHDLMPTPQTLVVATA